MQLRCPGCRSEETAPIDRGKRLECRNCGADFARGEALLSRADTEAELRLLALESELFRLDRKRAAVELGQLDGAIAVANPYSDADELNALADDALLAGIVDRARPTAHFAVYPLSLDDPEPILAVNPGEGPTLLGYTVKQRGREGESPADFTLRLLEDMVAEANTLAASYRADSARLDRIASYMNRPGPWNGTDVCAVVARELRESGRELLDNADK